MLAELCMELDTKEITFRHSSKFHGFMMEHIDTEYAELLHQNQLNPYSQFVTKGGEKTLWYIRTLTTEAYEQVILPLARVSEIRMKKGEVFQVLNRRIMTWDEKELLDEFYGARCERYFDLVFETPTAFKRDGKYVIYPDLRLIYGSLMRKYSAISTEWEMADEETLEELSENSEIVRYRLQTIPFPIEGAKINGFAGSILIRINGPETMARYVRLLLKFGEYSGIGIKTSLGMGAVHYGKALRQEEAG